MLIYLDANVVQYCATYDDFIFGDTDVCPVTETKLQKELTALRRLVELEQLGDWTFAAPPHLMRELRAGIPDGSQRTAYTTLQEAWSESAWSDDFQPDEGEIAKIEQSLSILKLKDAPDQRHLAEAIALNASWFLTNDKEVIRKANAEEAVQKTGGLLQGIRVRLPSECLEEISTGLFLK